MSVIICTFIRREGSILWSRHWWQTEDTIKCNIRV